MLLLVIGMLFDDREDAFHLVIVIVQQRKKGSLDHVLLRLHAAEAIGTHAFHRLINLHNELENGCV